MNKEKLTEIITNALINGFVEDDYEDLKSIADFNADKIIALQKESIPSSFMDIPALNAAWSDPKDDYDLGIREGIKMAWEAVKKL